MKHQKLEKPPLLNLEAAFLIKILRGLLKSHVRETFKVSRTSAKMPNAALYSLIDNSKIYLHRQKDIDYHREMYINFFKILEILLKTDAKKRELLRGQIEDTPYLAEREWLLEKL